jgi:hypothetical protein
MSIDAGIHIRLYRLHDGTAHLPFGSGARPGRSVSQFTIGTLVRLLSGHGGRPGHASLREAGRSQRRQLAARSRCQKGRGPDRQPLGNILPGTRFGRHAVLRARSPDPHRSIVKGLVTSATSRTPTWGPIMGLGSEPLKPGKPTKQHQRPRDLRLTVLSQKHIENSEWVRPRIR